jgi:sulfate/thiosulfate transport system ATP-binding protein
MSAASGVSVRNLSKRFGKFAALDEVSLDVAPGEFLALLGPSGSGKTSLLRAIAGLAPPDAGQVLVDGQDFLALSPRQRRVGMVFQHYALFRHMSVADNIAFGLKVRPGRERPSRTQIKERVAGLLQTVQLDGLGKRFPAQLSGGQRQRVALARALAIEPRILLLDEPFGALDAKVRKELRTWLRELQAQTKVTTVFVTHDQEEAMQVADRVAVMRDGRIEQVGAPADLSEHPASAFVFDFLGDANRLSCEVRGDTAAFEGFSAAIANPGAADGATTAWFRPHETVLASNEGHQATVVAISPRGGGVRLDCRDDSGAHFEVELQRSALEAETRVGDRVRLKPVRAFAFDR